MNTTRSKLIITMIWLSVIGLSTSAVANDAKIEANLVNDSLQLHQKSGVQHGESAVTADHHRQAVFLDASQSQMVLSKPPIATRLPATDSESNIQFTTPSTQCKSGFIVEGSCVELTEDDMSQEPQPLTSEPAAGC